MLGAWASVTDELRAKYKKGDGVAATSKNRPDSIADRSPTFHALRWVVGNLPSGPSLAAFVAAGIPGKRVDWANPTQVNAVLLFERSLSQILNSEADYHLVNAHSESNRLAKVVAGLKEDVVIVERQTAGMAKAAGAGEADGRERLAALTRRWEQPNFKQTSS